VVLDRGEQTIRAAAPRGPTRALGRPTGAPVLRFQRVLWADRPVEFVVSTYRGDQYEFPAALTVPAGSRAPGPTKEDSHEPGRQRRPARGPAPRSQVFAVLQRIGRSLMMPIAVLPAAAREPRPRPGPSPATEGPNQAEPARAWQD
jgi:hypothetical protein